MTVSSRPSGAYGRLWLDVAGRSAVTFAVRACAAVHIALAAVRDNADHSTYEVELGRAAAVIRDRGDATTELARANATTRLISCEEQRVFWLTWNRSVT